MRQASALQKVERAIDGRGLGGLAVQAVAGDQVIGLDRLARRQQQLQHPAARGGHALAVGGAARFDGGQGAVHLGGAEMVFSVFVIAGQTHGLQLGGHDRRCNHIHGRTRARRRQPLTQCGQTAAFAEAPAIG
ncbi:hypothetical protein D3C73_1086760 [compost metagenome]